MNIINMIKKLKNEKPVYNADLNHTIEENLALLLGFEQGIAAAINLLETESKMEGKTDENN